eukprot:6174340-Pleurochrysis_carterae.AAC.1
MQSVIPEIMHVGDLNIGKQIDKQAVMRHVVTYAREQIAVFYQGMGALRNTKKKVNGHIGSDWFKVSQFSEKRSSAASVSPVVRQPGLDNREQHAAAASSSSRKSASTLSSSLSLQQLAHKKFGKRLAVVLIRHALRCYDAYVAWRATCDLATPDDAAKERVALLSAVKDGAAGGGAGAAGAARALRAE